MVEHKVLRSRSEPSRHRVRGGCRTPPGSREFGCEVESAFEFDSTQDFGERIHSALWTPCQVPWSTRKGSASGSRASKFWRRSGMEVPLRALQNYSPEEHYRIQLRITSNKEPICIQRIAPGTGWRIPFFHVVEEAASGRIGNDAMLAKLSEA